MKEWNFIIDGEPASCPVIKTNVRVCYEHRSLLRSPEFYDRFSREEYYDGYWNNESDNFAIAWQALDPLPKCEG